MVSYGDLKMQIDTHALHVTAFTQAPKDWHLVLVVVLIISIAVPLVVGKTVSQRKPPVLLRDNENREGRMVRLFV